MVLGKVLEEETKATQIEHVEEVGVVAAAAAHEGDEQGLALVDQLKGRLVG